METVGPPASEPDLDLLLHWGDASTPGRTRRAAITSVLLHISVIVIVLMLPADFFLPFIRKMTPLWAWLGFIHSLKKVRIPLPFFMGAAYLVAIGKARRYTGCVLLETRASFSEMDDALW